MRIPRSSHDLAQAEGPWPWRSRSLDLIYPGAHPAIKASPIAAKHLIMRRRYTEGRQADEASRSHSVPNASRAPAPTHRTEWQASRYGDSARNTAPDPLAAARAPHLSPSVLLIVL